jgi:anti-sigma regulatory factor (Ser/Thr protein kinase)
VPVERLDVPGQIEHEFAGDPRSPAGARSFAKSALGDLLTTPVPSSLCDDVELVVSELVTNAVRAGSPTVRVGVAIKQDRVVVQVSDVAGGWPEPREAGIHDPHGRGLPLVSALSASWGVRRAPIGKVVWAELPIPSDLPDATSRPT